MPISQAFTNMKQFIRQQLVAKFNRMAEKLCFEMKKMKNNVYLQSVLVIYFYEPVHVDQASII